MAGTCDTIQVGVSVQYLILFLGDDQGYSTIAYIGYKG